VAGIASSRFFLRTTETSFVTNDTDVIFSDESVQAYNDLGVNFRVSELLSTRVFLRTDWTDSPLPGFEEFDNSVGLALVASF
jgi:putative salt-induced outer membrane protein